MKLERKQKILLTLIIIALAFLAWQLYDIFFASNVSEDTATISSTPTMQPLSQPALRTGPVPISSQPSIPSITTTTTSTTTPIPLGSPTLTRPTTLTAPSSTTVVQQTTTTPQVPPPPVIRQLTIQAPITAQQREYLSLVNRYQIIRMQRMLADEEAALYTSKAKVAELNQQISKITGSAVTNNLFGQSSSALSIGYQLMYIDYQNGRWTATLNQAGRFIEVNAGTTLPDGARVLKINQNGIVIRKWNRNYLLNFYGTTLLNSMSPAQTAAPASNAPQINTAPTNRSVTVSQLNVIRNNVNPSASTTTTTIKKFQTYSSQQGIKTSSAQHMSTLARHSSDNKINNANVTTLTTTTTPSTGLSQSIFNSKPSTPPTRLAPQIPNGNLNENLTGIPATENTANKNTPTPATAIAAGAPKVLPPHAADLTKSQVPLTPQQKTTVTQLESMDNKKPANPESYSTDEKHLLTLPGEYYTLQIMGSYKLSDLVNFIREHSLKDKAYTFHTYYLDKDWYVLIYGVYKTEDEALNAIKTLPPEIQRLKPWVRTIASVVEAIKLNPKQAG